MRNKLHFWNIGIFVLLISIISVTIYLINNSYAAYVPTANPLGSGVKNIELLYFDSNVDFDSNYKNVINYIDSNGNLTNNRFMDSFILLPASRYKASPSGNDIWNITTSDINNYLQVEFQQLSALNNRVKTINTTNNTNIKVNVFLSIIIPSNNKSSSAINSFVDSSISRFNSGAYNYLNLAGFYWYHEDVTSTTNENLVTSFNSYVHSKGYKTIWVPYVSNYNAVAAGESHINDWHRYGYTPYKFDFVSLQSGYYFKGDDEIWLNFRNNQRRLPFTNNEASSYNMGIELEADNEIYASSNSCNRLKEYLNYAISSNTGWNKGVNIYYIPSVLDNIEDGRVLYDILYKYSNGTLNTSDINNTLSCNKTYYSNFQNVSTGKSYSVVPFVNSSGGAASNSYLDDGKKLTDGKYGNSTYGDYGDEWVGFIRSIKSNLKYIDINLGKNETSLSYFALELEKDEPSGIKLPRNPIYVYVSDTADESTYKKVGTLQHQANNSIYKKMHYYSLNLGNNTVSGKYVRFAWNTDSDNEPFVFVSEAVVGKTSTITMDKNSSELKISNGGSFSVYITDGQASNLSISSSNTSVATATIDPDGMVDISPKGAGTANITVKDNRYGNYVTHKVTVIDDTKKLNSISVSTKPELYYFQNKDSLNLTGGKLKLSYSDDSIEYIDLNSDKVTTSGFSNTSVGKKTLTVSYQDKTTTFDVNIVPAIKISTKASDTNSQLANSKFTIYNSKCNSITSNTWKENFTSSSSEYETTLNISNSSTYYYCIVQNSVNDGYELNTSKVDFTVINKQATNNIVFTNDPKPKDYLEFNNLSIDSNNKIINKIKHNTTINSFKNNISTNGTINIYDANGKIVSDNSKLIGTGYKVKIILSNSTSEYTISVKGDMDGNGIINNQDIFKIADIIVNKPNVKIIEKYSADYNNDEKINVLDIASVADEINK